MKQQTENPIQEPPVEPKTGRTTYLIANMEKAAATFATDAGPQELAVRGSIGIEVTRPRGQKVPNLTLMRLNLVAEGLKTKSGNTGVLGLMLARQVPLKYDPRKGGLEGDVRLVMHYPLIDQKRGFREKRAEGDTCFVPFTETLAGRFHGRLGRPIPEDEGEVPVEMEVTAELAIGILNVVLVLEIWSWVGILLHTVHITSVLPIQPVFIGTGPEDASATGTAFGELMQRASEMWNRCGTVHCLTFMVRDPLYVDNDDYRVVGTEAEALNFLNEHPTADAVEIMVSERFETALAVGWGGGGTLDPGVASARIVTCDEQLDVPCPPPCGSGDCGDVNYYHLAHELGHVLNLDHPSGYYGLAESTAESVMEPSGFCRDNPNVQSAKNCRNASNPLLTWGFDFCTGSPDIDD